VGIYLEPNNMALSEADTKAKLIDPALHNRGWTEDLIRREETDRGIEIIDGKPRRKGRGRTDYLLRIKINISSQPVADALLEAKRSDDPPDKGFEQAKKYARLNHVAFVYSSNGHLFVEYDSLKGKTSNPNPISDFPTPTELRSRYEKELGISFNSEAAKPFLIPYGGGEASRRYYQDAAIRAALERIVQGNKHLLLYLATGSALAGQFEQGGIEELENPYVFSTPSVVSAGGLEALKILGKPQDIISETKKRLFAA